MMVVMVVMVRIDLFAPFFRGCFVSGFAVGG